MICILYFKMGGKKRNKMSLEMFYYQDMNKMASIKLTCHKILQSQASRFRQFDLDETF